MAKIEQAPKPGPAFFKRVLDDPELFAALKAAAMADQEYHPWRNGRTSRFPSSS